MIIFGSSDLGAKKYILSLKKNFGLKIKIIDNTNIFEKAKINIAITGTAIGPSLDKKIWNKGLKKKVTTIGILEHWTNFASRFILNKKKYYPDFIVVNDEYSKKKLLEHNKLSNKKIIISQNPLFEKIKKYKNYPLKDNILIISEYLIQKNLENKKIKFFEKIYNQYKDKFKIIIKPHPKDNIRNFNKLNKDIIILKKNMSSENFFKTSKFIIGFKSILLVELALKRGNVISFQLGNYIEKEFYDFSEKYLIKAKNFKKLIKVINSYVKTKSIKKKMPVVRKNNFVKFLIKLNSK